jgi:hypothetical protein
MGPRTSLQSGRGRAHSYGHYGHDLTRELQLIGFNTDRAAVQLGVSRCWGPQLSKTQRNGASSQLGYCRRLCKRNPSPNKRGRNGLSLSMLSRRLVQLPPSGCIDCGSGGRRGTIQYHTTSSETERGEDESIVSNSTGDGWRIERGA